MKFLITLHAVTGIAADLVPVIALFIAAFAATSWISQSRSKMKIDLAEEIMARSDELNKLLENLWFRLGGVKAINLRYRACEKSDPNGKQNLELLWNVWIEIVPLLSDYWALEQKQKVVLKQTSGIRYAYFDQVLSNLMRGAKALDIYVREHNFYEGEEEHLDEVTSEQTRKELVQNKKDIRDFALSILEDQIHPSWKSWLFGKKPVSMTDNPTTHRSCPESVRDRKTDQSS